MLEGIWAQFGPGADRPEDAIREGASLNLTDEEFIAAETIKWLNSKPRKMQIKGERYYNCDMGHDDAHKFSYDPDGMPIDHGAEYRGISDNVYSNLVDQKVNYILGKPFSIQSINENYAEVLGYVFDKNFKRMMQSVAVDALNCGIAWVHPYYNEKGELEFRHFAGHEVMPYWSDDEHTKLDMAIRYYESFAYVKRVQKVVHHVEVYSTHGINRYILENGVLIPDEDSPYSAYAVRTNEDGSVEAFNWERVPLVAFKYNQHEIPLIKRVLSLQDALNETRSVWDKNMQEDIRSAILAVRGYEGESVKDLRKKIMDYGAVLLSSDGDVEVLSINRESGSYTEYLDALKKAIVENGRGFDAKDDRTGRNPNEMNLRSMYSDIDLDSDMIESQFQASFDQLLWFVDQYLIAAGSGDFTKDEVTITFDRNMIVNDTDIINNIKNSIGVVSNETLLARHPFVTDVAAEQERLDAEMEKNVSQLSGEDYIENQSYQNEDDTE